MQWRRLSRVAGGGVRLLAGRLTGQPALLSAVVYLTQRCNLRCVYCSAPLRGTGELDTEGTGLLHTLRREPLARHGARRHAVAVRPGQRVPCQEERLHRLEKKRAVVEHVLHPDRLVEPNRRIVVGADEQADGRNAVQEQPAEIREPASRVPAPAH